MKEAIIQYNDIPSGGYMAISWKPLVRCKDCKWRGTEACFCKAKDDVKDDWFCSEGEKQT